MRLRPRSRSVSPKESAPKKKASPRKKKPSPPRKKDSPPPSVIRPDTAVDSDASVGMILRPRQKSPTEKKLSPPQPRSSLTEEKKKYPTEEEEEKKSPREEKKGKKKSPTEEEKKGKGKKKSSTEEEKKGKKKSPTEQKEKKKPPTEEVKRKVFPPVCVLAHKLPDIEMFRGFEQRLARMLSRIGFTRREYEYCTSYMWRLDFEYLDPTPKKYERHQVYVDQIRNTKGYGVTVAKPHYFYLRDFEPFREQWERSRRVRKYVAKMTGMVLDDIKVKLHRESYEAAGEEIDNLVKTGYYHLLSFQVHEGTPTDPPQTVEALFYSRPGGLPILENLMLLEWKIRKGSEVVFCTVPTYNTNF